MKIKSILFILMFSSATWAGFVKGNGGNTLLCHWPSASSTIELLDFFEAKLPMNDLHFSNVNEKSKKQLLDQVIALIDEVKPNNFYRDWIAEFESEAQFLTGVQLGIIADSFHFTIPKNCSVQQTIIQIEPLFREARYTVNEDIWIQMSAFNQAGLMIHELVYRDIKGQDSRSVRAITAFLFSDEIQNVSSEKRTQILKNLNFIK